MTTTAARRDRCRPTTLIEIFAAIKPHLLRMLRQRSEADQWFELELGDPDKTRIQLRVRRGR